MSFKEDGFHIIRSVLTEDECDRAAADIEAFYRSGGGSRVVNLHMNAHDLRSAITKQSVYDWINENCFKNPVVYTTLSFLHGTQQDIHRDVPHFHTCPKYQFVGVWYALEDATIENGCLEYIAGGHLEKDSDGLEIAEKLFPQSYALDRSELDQCMNHYQDEVSLNCQHLSISRAIVKKGDVFVWDARLPHGGGDILNPSLTRKSIVAHCVPEGTAVYNAKYFFNNIPLPPPTLQYLNTQTSWKVQKQPNASFQRDYV